MQSEVCKSQIDHARPADRGCYLGSKSKCEEIRKWNVPDKKEHKATNVWLTSDHFVRMTNRFFSDKKVLTVLETQQMRRVEFVETKRKSELEWSKRNGTCNRVSETKNNEPNKQERRDWSRPGEDIAMQSNYGSSELEWTWSPTFTQVSFA